MLNPSQLCRQTLVAIHAICACHHVWAQGISTELYSSAHPSEELDGVANATTFLVKLRTDGWVIPLIVLCSFNILVIAGFEVFVLYKAYGTNPSRRHLFLGQMLLLGLFLCSALGFAFVPTAHWLTCATIQVGLGLSYATVFATMLVKTVFLISLHGGIYLPASYQGLLLFFALAVQIVIGVQWLVQKPPEVVPILDASQRWTGEGRCSGDLPSILYTLLYSLFLILFTTILAIRAKGLRENHREAMFIGIAIGTTIPLWASWILVALATNPRYQDASLAFGIVINATLVFMVMFLPKGRQLAAMGRQGYYPEDRSGYSSHSPSVYTPSFLHLKPSSLPLAKQGTIYKAATAPSKPSSTERVYYVPAPATRVWRYGYPAYPQLMTGNPLDDSLYYSTERTTSCNPNLKFFRGPLY